MNTTSIPCPRCNAAGQLGVGPVDGDGCHARAESCPECLGTGAATCMICERQPATTAPDNTPCCAECAAECEREHAEWLARAGAPGVSGRAVA